jgi:ribonucleotide reductase alpha subunit
LFNAGTQKGNLSSCFLLGMEDDSIEGIFNTLKDCAHISKHSGGIGLHIHNVRAKDSFIKSTNGKSTGIVPMLRVFNNTARYINQGSKRNGSFAIYLETWHADIEGFLEMKTNHGDEESKGRDLFYALWIPDLFMKKVEENANWCLFCPNKCPHLSDVYGDEFEELYKKYETSGLYNKIVKARDLWFKILDSQMETGTPYLLYKDACNKKSNQKNLGTIKSSNLCVAPETKILTKFGQIEIQHLKGQKIEVWNGFEYSEVEVFQTGKDQEIIEVHTSDGCVLHCTKYHKFFIQRKNVTNVKNVKNVTDVTDVTNSEITEIVEAQHLKVGEKLKKCNFPVIDYEEEPNKMLYPYTRGYFSGAGYEIDMTDVDEETMFVPLNYKLEEKMLWFSGYCDFKGYISKKNELLIFSNSKTLLLQIKLMLQTCGINPQIQLNKELQKEEHFCLYVTSLDLNKLIELGFHTKELQISNSNNNIKQEVEEVVVEYIEIEKIVNRGRIANTYCFTEPKRNSGIFNGILASNCTEIIQYSDDKESSVCNLASIGLPSFVNIETKQFDYEKLHYVTKVVTENLNKIIDINYYPTEKTRISNLRHRNIGIGVQGLSDSFILMDIAFESEEAKMVNKYIFETIYHGALEKSNELSILNGPYETFKGSPTSQGILQFDMWNVTPSDRYDWNELKTNIVMNGLYNSLLLAPMPTASTSQILGFNECFEPFTSNIYSRGTLAGEFVVVNKYLIKELIGLGFWNEKIKNNIIANNGSIQQLSEFLPKKILDKYKIVWEIPMKHIIDMAADRAAYICQSQSMNLWVEDPNYKSLTSMHFYSFKKGLKTGIYYLRRKTKGTTQKFTIEPEINNENNEDEICEFCSS